MYRRCNMFGGLLFGLCEGRVLRVLTGCVRRGFVLFELVDDVCETVARNSDRSHGQR